MPCSEESAGTFCHGRTDGVFARKLISCLDCAFFRKVVNEEGWNLKTAKDILTELDEAEILPQSLRVE